MVMKKTARPELKEIVRNLVMEKSPDYNPVFDPNEIIGEIEQDPQVQNVYKETINNYHQELFNNGLEKDQISEELKKLSEFYFKHLMSLVSTFLTNPESQPASGPFNSKVINPYAISQKNLNKIIDKWKGLR